MPDNNEFNKFRLYNWILSSIILLWYFFDIKLTNLYLLKELGITNEKILVFTIALIQLFLLLEVFLEYKKTGNLNSKENNIQFFLVCIYSSSILILSYPKIIENTLFQDTTRLHLIIPIISSIIVMYLIDSLKASIEMFITFIKFKNKVYAYSSLLPLISILLIMYIIYILFEKYSSSLTFYNLVLFILTSIIYLYVSPMKRVFGKDDIDELKKVDNYKNRHLEVDGYIEEDNNLKRKLKNINPQSHKKIMNVINSSDPISSKFKVKVLTEIKFSDNSVKVADKNINPLKIIFYDENTEKTIEEVEIPLKYLNLSLKKIKISSDINKMINEIAIHAFTLMKIKTLSSDEKNELFCNFACDGDIKELKIILKEKDIKVDYISDNGWSALLIATANGHYDTVDFLLKKAANPNITNHYGVSPLIFASLYGKKKLCKLLIDFNADINQQDMQGITPLIQAIKNNHSSIVKILLDNNAEVTIKSKENKNALDYAKEARNGNLLKTLTNSMKR